MPDGTLTDISATGGTHVHLHYDNPLGRLTVKRVFDSQAVETLTQYRYDEHGQLSAVINRNGDTVRSFNYAEGLMVKSTFYRYDDRQHLVAVTDALNQTTALERKPDGEVLRITHPDGTKETFTYNVYGQVLSHTDGKGQTIRLMRTARGLPSSREDAKGQRVRYEYDKAVRLTALVNENNATAAGGKNAVLKAIGNIRQKLLAAPRDSNWKDLFG